MTDPKSPPREPHEKEGEPRKSHGGADAAVAQRDEADEEGAGQLSVPVEDLTTSNDAGQG